MQELPLPQIEVSESSASPFDLAKSHRFVQMLDVVFLALGVSPDCPRVWKALTFAVVVGASPIYLAEIWLSFASVPLMVIIFIAFVANFNAYRELALVGAHSSHRRMMADTIHLESLLNVTQPNWLRVLHRATLAVAAMCTIGFIAPGVAVVARWGSEDHRGLLYAAVFCCLPFCYIGLGVSLANSIGVLTRYQAQLLRRSLRSVPEDLRDRESFVACEVVVSAVIV